MARLVIRADVWIEIDGFESVEEFTSQHSLGVIEHEIQNGIRSGFSYGLESVSAGARVITDAEADAEMRGVS